MARRRKAKKKWIKPDVRAIDLNHNQAIIAACVVGGVYMNAINSCKTMTPFPGQAAACTSGVRGQSFRSDYDTSAFTPQDAPS